MMTTRSGLRHLPIAMAVVVVVLAHVAPTPALGAPSGEFIAASLNFPDGTAVDGSGNRYVVDSLNHRVLFYPADSTIATRVYGQGGSLTTDTCNKGGISADSLCFPGGLALDSVGNLYVGDTGNARVLVYPAGNTTAARVYGQSGSFTTGLCNKGGISADSLCSPAGVVVDSKDNLYVADFGNNRVLFYPPVGTTAARVYGQAGGFATSLCDEGGSVDSLCGPAGIAVDSSDNLYVADWNNNRVLFYPAGSTTATLVFGQGGNSTPNAANKGGEPDRRAVTASCSFVISPTAALNRPAAGGTFSVSVSTGGGCAWSASNLGVSWLSVSPATGTGPGKVTVSVAKNLAGSRSATISIAGKSFVVTQLAASCSSTITPAAAFDRPAAGDTFSVSVTPAFSWCSWEPSSSGVSWISVSPSTNSGPGTATVSVTQNLAGSRSATISIAGQSFGVSQVAAPCSFTLTPNRVDNVPSSGKNNILVSVSTGSWCNWSASNLGVSWIIASSAAHTGPGTVTFNVLANTAGSRSATISIAGQPFVVTQIAAKCTFSVGAVPSSFPPGVTGTATSVTVLGAGGSFSVNVTTSYSTCPWSVSTGASWISVSPATGAGPGTVTVTVAPMDSHSGTTRQATVTFVGPAGSTGTNSITVKQTH